jgi:hypothetical protein
MFERMGSAVRAGLPSMLSSDARRAPRHTHDVILALRRDDNKRGARRHIIVVEAGHKGVMLTPRYDVRNKPRDQSGQEPT